MKIGIVVDDWKLPVFRERLTEAGYSIESIHAGMTSGTSLITVEAAESVLASLKNNIEQWQQECAALKKKGMH